MGPCPTLRGNGPRKYSLVIVGEGGGVLVSMVMPIGEEV